MVVAVVAFAQPWHPVPFDTQSLSGVDMDHDRMIEIFDGLEHPHHGGSVVTALDVAVIEAEVPEDIVWRVPLRISEFGQVAIETSDVLVNGHFIVVAYDDELPLDLRCAVQPLEGGAAAERPVAYDRDDVMVLVGKVSDRGHACGQRYGCSCMA
jgi:hypothetical protein